MDFVDDELSRDNRFCILTLVVLSSREGQVFEVGVSMTGSRVAMCGVVRW